MIEPYLSDDRLLDDIEHHSRSIEPQSFHLWWLGQSGFLLQFGPYRIVVDPYLSDSLTLKYSNTDKPHVRVSRPVIDPARLPTVNCITSSHNHTDHLDAATIQPILASSRTASIVVPEANRAFASERLGLSTDRLTGIDVGQCARVQGIEIWAIPAAHPSIERDTQGHHKCVGYVFRSAGWCIYHSGDTIVFDGLVDALRPFPIDVAILPINGKLGNMDATDAAGLARDIRARVTIPCHYDMFEFNTAPPIAFSSAANVVGVRSKVLRLGEALHWKEIR